MRERLMYFETNSINKYLDLSKQQKEDYYNNVYLEDVILSVK